MSPINLTILLLIFKIFESNSLINPKYPTIINAQVTNKQLNNAKQENQFHLTVKTLETNIDLKLKNIDYQIFGKNFTMTLLGKNTNGEVFIEKIKLGDKITKFESQIHIDKESQAVIKISNNGETSKISGTIGKNSITHDFENHYLHDINFGEIDYEDLGLKLTPLKNKATQPEGIVEVFVVCDYKKYETFGGDLAKLAQYLVLMMHSVNNRYETNTNPDIKLLVTGAAVITDPNLQWFINEHKNPDSDTYDPSGVLNAFGQFVYQNKGNFEKHDLACLITEENFGTVIGRAFVNSACRYNNVTDKYLGVSINKDVGSAWIGFYTLSHEIAHNLGARHDGDSSTDGRDCPREDGYKMGDVYQLGTNKFYFSDCSKYSMNNYLNSEESFCLRNIDSETHWDLGNEDPGQVFNMTSQCKALSGNSEAEFDVSKDENDSCKQVYCKWYNGDGDWVFRTYGKPPQDHSPCGNGGRCWLGNCNYN